MPEIDLVELREKMEREREWREAEMRTLRNQLPLIQTEDERCIARKALVVMLYAHFEGVCKKLLTMYVERLNTLGLRVGEVTSALAAASLSDVFQALRDPNKKCREFKKALPDDAELHRFARDREFVEQTGTISQRPVKMKAIKLVNTKSNLEPIVLKTMLFRLGLDPQLSEPWKDPINKLLGHRNAIAHGDRRAGLEESDYSSLERAVKEVVDDLVKAISDAVSRKTYLAPPGS